MTVEALLKALHERGVVLKIAGDRINYGAPIGAMTRGLHTELAAHKPALMAHLRSLSRVLPADTEELSASLREAIRFARSESELIPLVEQIDVGYEGGQLALSEAERLAWLAVTISRQLVGGVRNIAAEELLAAPAKRGSTCASCDNSHWWAKEDGRRVCVTCHPDPRRPTSTVREGGDAA